MQKADCDSSLVHRLGVLAGAAQFTKNPDDEVRRKLHDAIVDLWTGSGKHCEKAEAFAQSGDKKGEYAFNLEFEHEISVADIEEELPPDLAEAKAKHDLVITQPSRLTKPTEWEFRLKFWQTRDRIYKAMMEGRRDNKKRKREEQEVKDGEEAPAPPAWATALTWKCADGVERTLLDRQLIYRGIFDAPAAAGLTERAPARDWAASLSERKAKEAKKDDAEPSDDTMAAWRPLRPHEESPFDKSMKDYIVHFMRDGKEESGDVCFDDGLAYIRVSVNTEDNQTRIIMVDRDEVYLIPGIAEREKHGGKFMRTVKLLRGNHMIQESMVGKYVQFHFDGGKEWGLVTADNYDEKRTYKVLLKDERGSLLLTIEQSRILKTQREKPTGADCAA